jgi:hypothetical protein
MSDNSPYEHIHKGTFTREFNRRPQHLHHLKNLGEFADYVLHHLDEFGEKTVKRARFYKNLIQHHGPPGSYGGSLGVKVFKEMIENSYKHDKNSIGQFTLQPISTHETQVWADYYTHHLVIVFTGTYNTFDWANNAQYVIGNYKNTSRFKNAERVFNLALEKFPNFKVTLVGHSQGGVPEHLLNDKRVYEALFLNPAWTTERQLPNEYIVKSTRDPVSLLVRPNKNNLFIPAKTMNPLHEHSTLILDDLPQTKLIGKGLTYKQKFNKKYGFPKDESHTIEEISKLSGYEEDGLHTIFNKGVGAYHTNPESVRPQVHSPEQWAMARIYSAVHPNSGASRVDAPHLHPDPKMMTKKQLIKIIKRHIYKQTA